MRTYTKTGFDRLNDICTRTVGCALGSVVKDGGVLFEGSRMNRAPSGHNEFPIKTTFFYLVYKKYNQVILFASTPAFAHVSNDNRNR